MSKKKKGNEDEKEHRSQMKGTVHASRAVSDKLRATLRSEEPRATRAVRLPPQRLSPCPPPTSFHLSLSPLRALFFPLNCVLATDATPGRRTSNAARNCPSSDHRYSLLSYFRLAATPSAPSLSIHIFAFHRLSLSPPPQQDVPLCCPEVPGRRGRRVRCERALQQRQERDRDAEAEAGDRPSGGRPRAGASAVLPVSGVRACVANCAALLCKWRSSALYVHRSRSVFFPLLRKKKNATV